MSIKFCLFNHLISELVEKINFSSLAAIDLYFLSNNISLLVFKIILIYCYNLVYCNINRKKQVVIKYFD